MAIVGGKVTVKCAGDVRGTTIFNGASLHALGGASLLMPAAGNYVDTSGCCGSLWEAQGAGSVLRLTGLTNFNGNGVVGWDALIRAQTGGRVELTNLTDVSGGAVSFFAENTNSLLDLSALTRTTNAARLSLEARTDAALLAPLLSDGLRVNVTRRARGQLPTAQFTRLQSAIADGATAGIAVSLTGKPVSFTRPTREP